MFLFMYVIQHCFLCRPSDSTVSEDAGIEPKTVATLTWVQKTISTLFPPSEWFSQILLIMHWRALLDLYIYIYRCPSDLKRHFLSSPVSGIAIARAHLRLNCHCRSSPVSGIAIARAHLCLELPELTYVWKRRGLSSPVSGIAIARAAWAAAAGNAVGILVRAAGSNPSKKS